MQDEKPSLKSWLHGDVTKRYWWCYNACCFGFFVLLVAMFVARIVVYSPEFSILQWLEITVYAIAAVLTFLGLWYGIKAGRALKEKQCCVILLFP